MATYVLVHGICHGAWCWEGTVAGLEARGHTAIALDLPLTSQADDAAAVQRALDEIAEPVILVGHSYGGLLISRAAAGRDDVTHLVYVAAVMLDADGVFLAEVAQHPPAPLGALVEITDDGQMVVSPEAASVGFFNCCDPDVARDAAAKLRPTPAEVLATPPGAEAWRDIPSTYLLCEQDAAIHPVLQRAMSARAGRVVTFDTDHSPFLSTLDPFVALLDEVGGAGGG